MYSQFMMHGQKNIKLGLEYLGVDEASLRAVSSNTLWH